MNSVMKSFMIVVVIFLGLVHAQAAEALMTREQAVAMLIQQVIEPSQNKDELMAFGPQNMLNAGDRVEPADLEYDTHPENAQTIQGPTWFFWVDTNKWSKFGHLVYFVYIDASNPNPTIGNGVLVLEQGWWPQINGVEYLSNSDERWVSADIVYGEAPTGF